ncbi:MAG: hypothetical protein MUF84_01075 [Anaerolineae bacterium]|jgi:hypothetical protein|nr:hypothetical protein [Anaerolineae bacterium]
MAASTFTFSGFSTPEELDPLGIWDLVISPVVPYAAGSDDRGLIWRVDHPTSSREAETALLAQRAKVEQWEYSLDAAARRLADLSPVTSYALGFGAPEAELLAQIAALQSPVLSYGLGEAATAAYHEVYEQANALLLQFKRLIHHFARIETATRGVSVALTAVDWTGDYETVWLDGATASDMGLHLEAVRLALESRHALLRLISVVTSGALSLTLKASVPGGQVLLLPAVYNYVRSILKELERQRPSEPVRTGRLGTVEAGYAWNAGPGSGS